MKIRCFGLALTLAGSLALARSARGDIPPPDGYVETCTIANQQTATSECLACRAVYFATDRCSQLLSPYCYSKVCRTWGGSAYTEVWCRTKGAGVPAVPSETLAALIPSTPLTAAPDGGTAPAPSSCLPYAPPAAPDAGGAGGQGGASAQGGSGGRGGTGGQSVIGGTSAVGGTGGRSVIGGITAAGGTGVQSVVGGTIAAGGTGGQILSGGAIAAGGTGGQSVIGGTTATGGQSALTSTPATGGATAVGGAGVAPAGGAGGTSGSDRGKPDDSSGCAVGGWLSAKALGPWLLAGLFGMIVMLARRRRR